MDANPFLKNFTENQWAVTDGLLSLKESQELLNWILKRQEQLKPARIGSLENKTSNTKIRSDSIRWIDPKEDPIFSIWNQRIQQLSEILRQEFYLPIKDSEFHFAHYPKGSFYSKHIDQPQSGHNRLVSIVHYLNPEWKVAWGGQILLHTEKGQVKIEPQSPATLLFQSHKVEHEVLPTEKDRFSLTGWLLG